MQTDRGISLDAVRVFAAAARLGSLKEAADALGVTAGAVSRRIAALEAQLSVRLFHRRNNAVDLSPEGSAFLDSVAPALATIENAVRTLRRDDGEIVVRASVSLAVRWLIPVLEAFKRSRPDMRIRIETSHYADVPLGANADAAITYRTAAAPPRGDLLLADRACVFVSPRLLPEAGFRFPEDMARLPALRCVEDDRDWKAWAAAAGLGMERIRIAHGFDTEDAAIHAAAAGLGMVLVLPLMARREVEAGSLVPLPGAPAARLGEYRLLTADRRRPVVGRLRAWLIEAAKGDAEDADP